MGSTNITIPWSFVTQLVQMCTSSVLNAAANPTWCASLQSHTDPVHLLGLIRLVPWSYAFNHSLNVSVRCSLIGWICLFVWLNKTRTVKPLRRFHSWRLSFTQDGLAFSTKTTRRALQFQPRSSLSTLTGWFASLDTPSPTPDAS